jgi:hypothetical protein
MPQELDCITKTLGTFIALKIFKIVDPNKRLSHVWVQ